MERLRNFTEVRVKRAFFCRTLATTAGVRLKNFVSFGFLQQMLSQVFTLIFREIWHMRRINKKEAKFSSVFHFQLGAVFGLAPCLRIA
jgi:hypothetical protein